MTDEWGPWIEHDGKGCPLSLGVVYQCELRCGCKPISSVEQIDLDGRDWKDERHVLTCVYCGERRDIRILRYRIRKPRGMTVLQEIVASPERELETA